MFVKRLRHKLQQGTLGEPPALPALRRAVVFIVLLHSRTPHRSLGFATYLYIRIKRLLISVPNN